MIKVVKKIKLIIPAGNASITPPVGPLISQAGISAKEFCMKFNDLTKNFYSNLPLRVLVKVFDSKSDNFEIMLLGLHKSFFKSFYSRLKKRMDLAFVLFLVKYFLFIITSGFVIINKISLYSFIRNFFCDAETFFFDS